MALIAFLASESWSGGAALGEEFRIATRVYADDQTEPFSQSTTLFREGYVYDFPAGPVGPADITVFHAARGRFVLLDTTRQVRTELTCDNVDDYVNQQRALARGQRTNAFLRFLAEPVFDETFDRTSGVLTLTSPWMTYRLTTLKAKNSAASQQYADFSDWYAKLNTLLNAQAPPPFARMLVNEALFDQQALPLDVTLLGRSSPDAEGEHQFKLRSDHQVEWRLLPDDRRLLEEVHNHLVTFELVPFETFVAPDAAAAPLQQ